MKTATVSQLRNNCREALEWVAKGEEVELTLRGKVVAKIVSPEICRPIAVPWCTSATLNRQRLGKTLTAEPSAAVRADLGSSIELH